MNTNINNFNDFLEINGNLVHPTAVVYWNRIKIGTGNIIYPYVCIGTDAQHRHEPSVGKIQIGNNNVFREHSTVNLPTQASNLTHIGNDNYFMINSHVAHDCYLENNITMCNNSVLAGHVYVMQFATIALGAVIHQFQTIGSYTMLGMNSVVGKTHDIVPGKIFAGNPVKVVGENKVGLKRNNVSFEMLEFEKEKFWKLRL